MSRASKLELEKRNQLRLSATAIKVVRFLAGIVAALIAWKILQQFIADFSLSTEGSWAFVQITVIIYFWSWFLAALRGIEVQTILLNTTGKTQGLPFPAYFALLIGFPIGLSAMLVVLFPDDTLPWVSRVWTGGLTEFLVVILAVFWIWDMLWQWSVRKTVVERIEKTKSNLEGAAKRYIEREQLKYLEEFISGKWRIVRKITGVVIIGVLLFSVFFFDHSMVIPIFGINAGVGTFVAVTTFIFVVVSEGWTWIMRHRMSVGINALERIGVDYALSKKSDSENH